MLTTTIKGIRISKQDKEQGVIGKTVLLKYLEDARELVSKSESYLSKARSDKQADYNKALNKWKKAYKAILIEAARYIDFTALAEKEANNSRGWSRHTTLSAPARPLPDQITFYDFRLVISDSTFIAKYQALMDSKPEAPDPYAPTSSVALHNLALRLAKELELMVAEIKARKDNNLHLVKAMYVVRSVDGDLRRLGLSL